MTLVLDAPYHPISYERMIEMVPEDLPRRLSDRIRLDDRTGCWEWIGSRTSLGYGRIKGPGRRDQMAHRLVYEVLVGMIPDGLVIDHLCRNPGCVNPEHLEAVTTRENIRRGESPVALNARRTHCVNGHPFDAANTYIWPQTGRRTCRTCGRQRVRDAYWAKREVDHPLSKGNR